MVPWHRFWAERHATLIAVVALLMCAAAGLLVELLTLPARPSLVAMSLVGLDLFTGIVICGCGIAASLLRRDSRVGPALLLTGLLWFAGTAVPADAVVRYMYRGPLIYALLAAPARGPWRRDYGAIAIALVAGAAGPLWESTLTAVLLAGMLALWAAGRVRVPGWLDPPPTRVGAWSSLAFATAIAGVKLLPLAVPSVALSSWLVIGYDLLLVVIVAGLTGRLLTSHEAMLADLVLELGANGAGSVRDRLADALADPTVEIAYVRPDGPGYVDERGREIRLPDPGARRAATTIRHDGQAVAVILHDPARLDDPELSRATTVAAGLLERQAALSGALAGEIAELDASRRRLALAADVERQRIEGRLRSGPIARLTAIDASLERARRSLRRDGLERQADLDRALVNVGEAIRELDALGRGLRPPRLTEAGLDAALSDLGQEATLPVDLSIEPRRLPPAVEVAAYYVAVEALANVAKHAHATRASIELRTTADRVNVVITDDGVGGANLDHGSGLRGLRDRVLSLGGDLDVSSVRGKGTTVRAAIPLVSAAGGGG